MNPTAQSQGVGNIPPFTPTRLLALANTVAEVSTGDLRHVIFNNDNWRASHLDDEWGKPHYAPLNESLYLAFAQSQTRAGNGNEVLAIIEQFLDPGNFVNKGDSARFNKARLPLNKLLRLDGLEFGEDGKFYPGPPATTIADLERWETNPGRNVRARPVGSPPDAINADGNGDLWPVGFVRAFISHRADCTDKALILKTALERRGIGAFVAYAGVQPARRWEQDILRALDSANITIPIMTSNFRDSDWTDHEIGISIGRRLPIVPVRVGSAPNPYGFMGSRQALSIPNFNNWDAYRAPIAIADDVLNFLLTEDVDVSSELRTLAIESFIEATRRSGSFNSSDRLAALLADINSLTAAQENALVTAINGNRQVQGSNPFLKEAVDMLFRVNGNRYKVTNRYTVEKQADNPYGVEGTSPDDLDDLPF